MNTPLKNHATAGTIAHQGIAHFTRLRRFVPAEIDHWVRDRTPADRPNVNDRAHRSRIGSAIRAYGWEFLLPAPWRLTDSELHTANGDVDLVWSDGERWIFDEIKVSHITGLVLEGSGSDQTDRYARFGVANLGGAFLGVRCLPLFAPSYASFKPAPGRGLDLPQHLKGGLR